LTHHDRDRETHPGEEGQSGEAGETGDGKDPTVGVEAVAAALGHLTGDGDGDERPEAEDEVAATEEAGTDAGRNEFTDGGGPGNGAEGIGKGGDAQDDDEDEVAGGDLDERQGGDESPGEGGEDEGHHHDGVQGHAASQGGGQHGLNQVAQVGQRRHQTDRTGIPSEGGDGEGDDKGKAWDGQVQHRHTETGLNGRGLQRKEQFPVPESVHVACGPRSR